MKPSTRPTHPFLPPEEDRARAIDHATRQVASGEPIRKLELKSHDATFRSIGKKLHVVYTPRSTTNMQTCDVVNLNVRGLT